MMQLIHAHDMNVGRKASEMVIPLYAGAHVVPRPGKKRWHTWLDFWRCVWRCVGRYFGAGGLPGKLGNT